MRIGSRPHFHFVLLLCVLFLSSVCDVSAQQFQVLCKVLEEQTERPLDRTWVGMYDRDRLVVSAWTNEKGVTRLPPVGAPLGTYWLEIRSSDKDFAAEKVEIEVADWDLIEVTATLQRRYIEVFSVEGRVVSEDTGEPLPDVWLGLYEGSECLGYGVTGLQGYYYLTVNAGRGRYRIEARPLEAAYRSAETKISVEDKPFIRQNFTLEPLPEGARTKQGPGVVPMRGQVVIDRTDIPVKWAEVTLSRRNQSLASTRTDIEGKFFLHGVPAGIGECELEVEPNTAWLVESATEVIVGLEGIGDLVLGMETVFEGTPELINLTGEVFSAGGGRALSGVRVFLLCEGKFIARTETNSLGKYEFLEAPLVREEVQLVFFPRNYAFLPLLVSPELTRSDYQFVRVVLPTQELEPVESIRLRGEVTSALGDHSWGYKVRISNRFTHLIEAQFRQANFDWGLQIPRGNYRIDIVDTARVLKMAPIQLRVEKSTIYEHRYRMRPSAWLYLAGAVAITMLLLGGTWLIIRYRRSFRIQSNT